ncbi:hypothetical protein H9632_18585 [Solibacillus sp. Sa1YVA6]|uniref:Uncharacterized protein n=1 Tax=Solibacillus merdavium TaxID=2762218 RepID=A0ABR8XSZ8_9BACL|nr:hypothetical protein [Solibacillus merdavium]
MERKEKDPSCYHWVRNEKGALFMLAILLLFVVTGSAILYSNAYFAQLKFYNSLESIYVRATINILNTQ